MTSLASNLRNKLERVVVEARDIAELGAQAAIEALAVHHHEPYGHMSIEERNLRNSLRAHARQVGDRRDATSGAQKINHLVSECAYEHWHRMLFARFLAENNLLIEPETGVAVSLEECEEIAKEEGGDTWTLASRYAQQMLPQIFRADNPLLQVSLPREHRLKLEKLLDSLDSNVFTASDSLGWVYQFWQSKKKEAVNRSEKKIGGDELPAVTQLFTEPYMVAFLLDNSLGAWWAARRLSVDDLKNASGEEELRCKASISGLPLKYLRFIQAEDDTWAPAAGSFEAWPQNLRDLKILDPCCGSGHFLVATFLMLVPMRMELEHLTAKEAVDAVLQENIHGLELDQRCVELAAFALALTAWRYYDAGGYRPLPELSLACTGLSVSVAKDEWKKLALDKHNLAIALDWMYEVFKDAPILGSLLNPAKSDASKLVKWDVLSASLERALGQEQTDEQHEAGVVAHGLARAATMLAGNYHLVITNVPYLARGKQAAKLQTFCERIYPASKSDLATVFLDRCLEFCAKGGTTSIVLPHNWLFMASYKKFREKLLKNHIWHVIARLGEGGFDSAAAAGAFVAMITLSRGNVPEYGGGLFGESIISNVFHGIDVSEPRTSSEKAVGLVTAVIKSVNQSKQLQNPDSRVTLDSLDSGTLLSEFSDSFLGLGTGGFEQFGRYYWEFAAKPGIWAWLQSSAQSCCHYDGLSLLVAWDWNTSRVRGMDKLYRDRIHNQDQSGQQAWGKKGVGIALMRGLRSSIFLGCQYDKSMAAIIPQNEDFLNAIYTYCSSPDFHDRVREIDQNIIVANGNLVKIPFDIDYWSEVATERYPNGLPKPYSDDPTQWIFHGHPCGSVVWDKENKRTSHGTLRNDQTVLQVAVARLLGYRWPAELDTGMELADEQREWVKRCDSLLHYADEDGIVCLSALRKEDAAIDRLGPLLSKAFEVGWSPAKEHNLLAATGTKAKDLDDWLRNDFFEQHCKLFGHHPFIWHIWDGRKRDGFHALVNYHKLAEGKGKGRKLLEKLTYGYLGDWINLQKDGVKQGTGGAEDRLAAALELEKRLKAILEGEPPFDIFVRWKTIEEQPVGWEPDINDGVRLNIRPFMASDIPGGRTGAGILRWAPNVKWDKDRGKDVESAPWHSVFNGERLNDYHLTNAEKMAARARINKGENS